MIGTILVLFIVLPLVVRSVDDETIQRLPTDSPNNHPFFEDLKLDVEHSLTVNNHGDYFYVIRMPSPNQPLFLTFTPCQKPVHWQIRIPNHFATQPNIHPRTDHLRHVLHLRIPPLIELPEESQQKDKLVLLAGEENEKRMDFYASSIEAEYVLLNVWSTGNTMLKVFATTTKSKRDAIYPTLPENATVDYSLSTKDNQTFEVELNWLLPEQLLNVKDDSKHRFCVLVSEKQPHHAICDEPNDVDVDSIHCTKKTSMRIPNLRPNHRYYATVHLHNQKSGGSSAYHPIEFRTPESNKKTSDVMEAKGSANRIHKSQKLPDGVLMKHSVAQPKDNANVYVYEPAANFQANGKILLVVYACNGYIRVAINKNDMVEKSDFIGLHQFVIDERNEHLQVSVINDDRVPVDYWIWMSQDFHASPFAILPEDRSLRSLSRSCNSILLEWTRAEADENVRYCVHQKISSNSICGLIIQFHESRPDYFTEIVHERMCFAEMNVGRKAVCFYSNETEPLMQSRFILSDLSNSPMQTTVHGLKPKTTYRFDVSAQRIDLINSQPLSYRPLFIRTLDQC